MTNRTDRAWGEGALQPPAVEALYLERFDRRGRAAADGRAAAQRIAARLRRSFADVPKRSLDLVVGSLALAAAAPLLAVVAACIKLEDGGPVFFAQQRVGRRGRPFRMLKFRSMVVDAEQRQAALAAQNESAAGVLFKLRADPRITRVGRIIRRSSVDELPQLLNVLRGDMSLVGPRPALPREVAQYTQEQRLRLAVLPGITGPWQVGGRSDVDFHGQVRLDVDYIGRRSLRTDLILLLRTLPAVIGGRGAC